MGSLPNMLFLVVDRPETDETKGGKSGGVESKVMSRNGDGKSLVREYVFRAKL